MSLSNGCHNTDEPYADDDFEEIKIEVPWGHIAGKWWGPRQTQPMLAIHGWQDNAGSFDTLVPLIRSERTSILCIDLPGHGFSSHQPKGQYYYVAWNGLLLVRRIVNHFGWKQITILGHSLGGAIAFLYAAAFPNDVKLYIAMDIVAPSPKKANEIIPELGVEIDKFLSNENGNTPDYTFHHLLNRTLSAYQDSLTEESARILFKRGIKNSEQNKNRYCYTRDVQSKVVGLAFFSLSQILGLAHKIKCDVLNIRSSLSNNFQKSEYFDLIVDTITQTAKRCESHVVEGTHHVHLNNPEKIAPIILNFLSL